MDIALDQTVVSLLALIIIVVGLHAAWRLRLVRVVICAVLLYLLATLANDLTALAG